MSNDCPNCGGDLRKTGYTTPGNTPEKSCTDCWWANTDPIGLRPKDQGHDLSRAEAQRRWNR